MITTIKKIKTEDRVRKEKKNSTTKVKARNFLTNISYRCYKPKDFKNEAFLIDIYSLVLQNLNTLMININLKLKTIKTMSKCSGINVFLKNLVMHLFER